MATFKINCPNGQQFSVEQQMMPITYMLTDQGGHTCQLVFSHQDDKWEFSKTIPSAEAWQIDPDEIIEEINKHL